MPLMRRGLDLR